MTWILLAAAGQFLNAVVAILDKYIVSDERVLPRPFVYAFYSCLITAGWIAMYLLGFVPWLSAYGVPSFSNIESPSIQVVGMSFLSAYTFFMALVSMYTALKKADASDVMPVIGAVSAITAFGMVHLFLDAELTPNYIWGIALLVTGTLLVSQLEFTLKTAIHTVHSGIFFALHYISMKALFMETSFDDGFFWSRIGFVVFALSLLLVPSYYEKIFSQTKDITPRAGMLVMATKILAGVAAFMLLKATDWGDVAVVQALDGLKFVFIILLGVLIGRFIPATAGENVTDVSSIVRKTLYVAIISIGFIILFT